MFCQGDIILFLEAGIQVWSRLFEGQVFRRVLDVFSEDAKKNGYPDFGCGSKNHEMPYDE